jgi:hypothetical protein
MIEMARDENVPLTEVAVEVVKSMLDGFNSPERLDAARQFREMGIDLEEVFHYEDRRRAGARNDAFGFVLNPGSRA